MSEVKIRWPRVLAIAVARELVQSLEPVCERLIVAGSLRRGRADVGDVEILYIARTENQPFDLFSSHTVSLADAAIDQLTETGVLSRRLSCTGAASWGAKNKLAVHRTGMPVDLFAASTANWWNYLVCRTGPALSNTRIATLAREKGWQWNPYGEGFSRPGENGEREIHPVTSEEAVFKFVGLPYQRPEDRQ